MREVFTQPFFFDLSSVNCVFCEDFKFDEVTFIYFCQSCHYDGSADEKKMRKLLFGIILAHLL